MYYYLELACAFNGNVKQLLRVIRVTYGNSVRFAYDVLTLRHMQFLNFVGTHISQILEHDLFNSWNHGPSKIRRE
jgi:hypothetical protein